MVTLVLVLFAFLVALAFVLRQANERLDELAFRLGLMEAENRRLGEHVAVLRRGAEAAALEPAAPPAPEPAWERPQPVPRVEAPPPVPLRVAAGPSAPAPPAPAGPPVAPAAVVAASIPPSRELPPPPAPPTPRPEPAAPPSSPPAPPKQPFDWEDLVGVKLFSWGAGILLALAALYFLRYSIDHGWLLPPVRMAMGVFTGIGLLAVCELKVARRYAVTANALDGAGIAILFSTLFASHALWHLLGAVPAFVLMALVAAVAVALSLRRDSLFIALLGLVGGFATPVLLASGEDRPIPLFGYLLLLNAGLTWTGRRRSWPALPAVSLAFTALYQWAWVARFLDAARVPLAAAIFLVFPLFAFLVSALARSRKAEDGPGGGPAFARIAAAGAVLPLLFAVYLAAMPAYGERYGLLFGFLLVLDAGLAWIAARRGPQILHHVAAGATLFVTLLWLGTSYQPGAWPGILGLVAALVLFYLAAPWVLARLGSPLARAGHPGTLAAPLLLSAFPVLVAIEPAAASPWLPFGILLALVAATAAFALLYEDRLLHLLAAFFAVVAQAAWSLRHLSPDRLLAGASVYAAFGLFYLGVPLAARRLGRAGSLWAEKTEAEGETGYGLYLAHFAYLFLLFAATRPGLALPPWPLLGGLAVLGLAAGAVALHAREGLLHAAALALSGLVLLAGLAAHGGDRRWTGVAAGSAAALAAFALLWIAAARRAEGPGGGALVRLCAAGALASLFCGQLVLIEAGIVDGALPLGVLVPGQVAFLAALLAVASARGWSWAAPLSVPVTAAAVLLWRTQGPAPASGWGELAFAGAIYLVYLAYPFALGARARQAREPFLAAVLASVAFFFFGRHALVAAGLGGALGALPMLQAVALTLLLVRLLRLEPAGERDQGRLALVAGAVLAGITVAIPLQLDREWITLGWALLAAALAWLHGRIPHRGLLAWTAGLLAAVFVRLALNPAVLDYHPRGDRPLLNWYLYAYLVAAASFFLVGWLLQRGEDRLRADLPRLSAVANGAATMLLFLLVNIEIADFFSTGESLTFGFLTGEASLGEDLAYTLGWAGFAIGLLAAGIALRNRTARIAALGLLIGAVLKGFLHDLAQLGGLYKVVSFVGLAGCLALVAILIQRFVLSRREEA